MTVTLPEFSQHLCTLMGAYPADLRPFVCCGSPLDCKIFIVGANATPLQDPFWPFWNNTAGFKCKDFLEYYRAAKRGKLGNARERIQRIVESAAPCKCLETNIWSRPSVQIRDLPPKHRSTDIFDFLLRCIKPKIIYLHGRDAFKHFQDKLGNDFPLTERKRLLAPVYGDLVTFYATNHLIHVSYQEATSIGILMKQWLSAC